MSSKRILLISPPFYRIMGSHHNGIHLGICYISSVLKKNGHEVIIYNADFCEGNSYLDQRKLYENFEHYKIVLNDLNNPIWKEVKDTIKDVNPEYVGIQMYTGTFKSSQNVAAIAKEINPAIKVVVGGTHPTLDPLGTIRFDSYDYIVRGEGEFTLLELLNDNDLHKIDGLTFRTDDNEIVNNKGRNNNNNLDDLPFPDRDNFYSGNGKIDVGAVITSRGCPFQCTYCSSPQIWNRKTNYRSVENVLEELKYLVKHHNISLIRFQDDTFTLNKERAVAIFEGILKNNLNINWICDTRVDKLDRQLIKLMKKAGCARIKVGVESGSDDILKRVKKGITTKQIKEAIGFIKDVGISLTTYFMIGFPGETDEDVKKTIQFAEEIQADYNSLSIIAPYYGTEMYKGLVNDGFDFSKCHWEYFFHQSKEMLLNTKISEDLRESFLNLNEQGKGERL